jgi:phosphotransferase system, enzyme I, PtsP
MLKALRRIINEANGADTIEKALDLMVSRVRRALYTDVCSIYLLNKKQSKFILAATDGLDKIQVNNKEVVADKGIISFVLNKGEIINLADATLHTSYMPLTDGEEQFKGLLAIPIKYRRNPVGVLLVQRREAIKYDEAEEAFLLTISAQLARLLESKTDISKIFAPENIQANQAITLRGIPSAPGVGIGTGVIVYPKANIDAVPDKINLNSDKTAIDAEIKHFFDSLHAVKKEIAALKNRLKTDMPQEDQILFDAYLQILDDKSLGDVVVKKIRQGVWAQGALKQVIKKHVSQFELMDDEYLRERAADIKDLGSRVLAKLQSQDLDTFEYPENTILIGEEVSATNLAEVPQAKLAGIISLHGSSNSHVAILARSLGVPTVMGVENLIPAQLEAKKIIIDGYFGKVHANPSVALSKAFAALAKEEDELDAKLLVYRDKPAVTSDGEQISLCVNAGLMADVGNALSVGADGVGLYRTEIPFMVRDCFPSADEQRSIYHQVLSSFAPKPVTMRILDVGGDKKLSYFPIEEENPFLGWRGIRMLLDHPEIFAVQIRALLRASENLANLKIMLPMVNDTHQVDSALVIINTIYDELISEGLKLNKPAVGVMIEVPSLVYQIGSLAHRIDFISVGSNDLTQYLLAVDRNNEQVSNLYDALHPSVIKILMQIAREAKEKNLPFSICGELAGDPLAVILLIAMGYTTLSMSSVNILRTKWIIQHFSSVKAKKILSDVLEIQSAKQIRKYMEQVLDEVGLGAVIRAGNR